ncbi:MAG: hypothetical protein EBS11_17775 [Janthinobacterium sp.]|nr:hypothetical protein [Janthinobacterium sp.]
MAGAWQVNPASAPNSATVMSLSLPQPQPQPQGSAAMPDAAWLPGQFDPGLEAAAPHLQRSGALPAARIQALQSACCKPSSSTRPCWPAGRRVMF